MESHNSVRWLVCCKQDLFYRGIFYKGSSRLGPHHFYKSVFHWNPELSQVAKIKKSLSCSEALLSCRGEYTIRGLSSSSPGNLTDTLFFLLASPGPVIDSDNPYPSCYPISCGVPKIESEISQAEWSTYRQPAQVGCCGSEGGVFARWSCTTTTKGAR